MCSNRREGAPAIIGARVRLPSQPSELMASAAKAEQPRDSAIHRHPPTRKRSRRDSVGQRHVGVALSHVARQQGLCRRAGAPPRGVTCAHTRSERRSGRRRITNPTQPRVAELCNSIYLTLDRFRLFMEPSSAVSRPPFQHESGKSREEIRNGISGQRACSHETIQVLRESVSWH